MHISRKKKLKLNLIKLFFKFERVELFDKILLVGRIIRAEKEKKFPTIRYNGFISDVLPTIIIFHQKQNKNRNMCTTNSI